MLRGYRIAVIAIVGWLALTGWAEAHGGGKGNYYKHQSTSSQRAEPSRQAPPLKNPPDAVSVQSPCDNAITDDQRDLCQQWRMAEAADQLVDVSWAQVILTALSLIGLGFTIWYTYMAAHAANTAATAALESNKVTREIGQAQVRAYLHCDGGSYAIEKSYLQCQPLLVNTGQSPASNIKITAVGVITVPKAPVQDVLDPNIPSLEIIRTKQAEGLCEVISAGGTKNGFILWTHVDIGTELHDSLIKNGWDISMNCHLHWTDVFGHEHMTAFLLDTESSHLGQGPDKGARLGKMRVFNQSIATDYRTVKPK